MADDEAPREEKPEHELIGFEFEKTQWMVTLWARCSCGGRRKVWRYVAMPIWAFWWLFLGGPVLLLVIKVLQS